MGENHYGLVAPNAALVAAATALHGLHEDPDLAQTYTYVSQIAVAVGERGHGHGRELMQHIMGQGALAGDGYVMVAALEPAFFDRLGFAESGQYMRASLSQAA